MPRRWRLVCRTAYPPLPRWANELRASGAARGANDRPSVGTRDESRALKLSRDAEVNFNIDLNRDRFALLEGGLEPPLAHGGDRSLVELRAQRALDSDVTRLPVRTDNYPQYDSSFQRIRFDRIFRVRRFHEARRGDSGADLVPGEKTFSPIPNPGCGGVA